MIGFGPLGCRPWPHLPFGKPPCRVGQVGEGVSPSLDADTKVAEQSLRSKEIIGQASAFVARPACTVAPLFCNIKK